MKLYEYSTDELMEELFSRFDSVVFHGMRNNYENKLESNNIIKWTGLLVEAIGLAAVLKRYLLVDIYPPIEDTEEKI